MALIQTCESLDTGNQCVNPSYVDAYLLPPDSAPMLELLLAGGFNEDAAMAGFLGVFTLFAAGLAVGIIVNLIRKLRI